jgi:hypothetical protein
MLEKYITKKIRDYLRQGGYIIIKVAGGQFQSPGISDIIACSPEGRFVAIEVKQPGKQPTPLQLEFLLNVHANKGFAMCVHSLDELKEALWDKSASNSGIKVKNHHEVCS